VSSIKEPFHIAEWQGTTLYNKIGITDTEDGKEEFYTNNEVLKFIKEKNINIYGTYCYGVNKYRMFVFATPMEFDVKVSESKLKALFKTNKERHNPWSLYPIEDYLASLGVATKIIIFYSYVGDGDRRRHSSRAEFVKRDIDSWYYEDKDNAFSGDIVDSRGAANFMDYPSCCMTDLAVFPSVKYHNV